MEDFSTNELRVLLDSALANNFNDRTVAKIAKAFCDSVHLNEKSRHLPSFNRILTEDDVKCIVPTNNIREFIGLDVDRYIDSGYIRGEKVESIKNLRKQTRCSLIAAKKYVEFLDKYLRNG